MVGNVAHMNSAHPCPPPQAGERAMRKCPQRSLCGSAVLRSRGFWVQFHAGGNSTADLRRSPYTSFPAVSFLILLEAFIAPQNTSPICNHCPIVPVFICPHFSGVVPEELFPGRQVLVDCIKMQSPPFAGGNGFFQFFSLSASPEDQPGALSLLFLGFVNNVQNRLSDVRVLIRA